MFHNYLVIHSRKTGDVTVSLKSGGITLRSSRLELRSLNLDRYHYLVKNYLFILGNQSNVNMLQDGNTWSAERVKTMVKTEQNKQDEGDLFGRFSVYNRFTQELMGSLIIRHLSDDFANVGHGHKNVAEIGYFFDKAFWGKGYGTETARIGIMYIKHFICKPHRSQLPTIPSEIVATADPQNYASASILRKTLKECEPEIITKFGGNQRLFFFKSIQQRQASYPDKSALPKTSLI